MSWRRVCASAAPAAGAPATSAPGSQPRREDSQPQNSSADASESSRWRTVTPEIARSSGRRRGESNAAATRSRHGVERSQARSTT